jgi:outer membrane biosynthesis protein TonB
MALVTLVVATALVGCKQEDLEKAKKLEEMTALLQKAKDREAGLKEEVDKLQKRVTQLQNDFKIYSQKPCDFELDAIEYTIAKKEEPKAAPPPVTPRERTTADPPKKPEDTTPPAEVADVPRRIRAARYDIKTCYESALRKNPALQSGSTRVTLKFTINPSGSVSNIQVNPPVGSGFEGCVRGVIGPWSFAKFTGSPKVFSQPMNLKPQ